MNIRKLLLSTLMVGGFLLFSCDVAVAESVGTQQQEEAGDLDSFFNDLDDVGDIDPTEFLEPDGDSGDGAEWEQFKLIWEDDKWMATQLLLDHFKEHIKKNKGKCLGSVVVVTMLAVASLKLRKRR